MALASRTLGQWAEQQASHFLQQQGYQLLRQNYHSRYGEIDLIMVQAQQLVFVEVKARQRGGLLRAEESISSSKQRKIIQTAQHFLAHAIEYQDFYCRFDVICLEISSTIAKTVQQDFPHLIYDLQWIENAFTLD
ncbi:YraN family protein [Acinetobacter sp. CAAS 2-6]|uniref:YraN family protein n=1 Tax=Acinetobacter sp. CAAS 2-6 TaxID=3016358 RepID=UPI002DD6950E|nr:YraN family protein [Acinetobacter sp. CAAS 2-6]